VPRDNLTVALSLWTYGVPRGVGVSHERGSPCTTPNKCCKATVVVRKPPAGAMRPPGVLTLGFRIDFQALCFGFVGLV
jgi:hypothetical protein